VLSTYTAGVEFRNRLQTEFDGVNLPNSMVFDYPTVTAARQQRTEVTCSDQSLKALGWPQMVAKIKGNTGNDDCTLWKFSATNGKKTTLLRGI